MGMKHFEHGRSGGFLATALAVFLVASLFVAPAGASEAAAGANASQVNAPDVSGVAEGPQGSDLERGDVTITISAWLWQGSTVDDFLSDGNWFSGFGWLNPPSVFPVYLGPVVRYVQGFLIDPFIPTASMPVLSSNFTGPSFRVAGSDIPVIFTIEGATYTVTNYAEVGGAPHGDYTPTGPQVPGVLKLDNGGVAGYLTVGLDAIGKLVIAGSSHVDDLYLAADEGSVAILEIECGGSLNIDSILTVGNGTVVLDSCGRVEVPNSAFLTVAGGQRQLGEIDLQSSGGSSGFAFASDLTLEGNATFTLSGLPEGHRYVGNYSGAQLIVPSSSTLTFRDGSGYLYDGVSLSGEMAVSGGAFLEVDQTVLDGGAQRGATPGVLRIQDGSTLRLGQLSALRGAALETEGTGELRGSSASDLSSGLIEDSTVNGRVRLASYEYLSLGGTVHLDGEIVIDTDPGLTSALHFRSPTTFEGDGRITLLGDSTSYQAIGQYSGNTMAIPTGSSLTIGGGGSGYLLEDVSAHGLLQVTEGAEVVVDQSVLDGGGTQAGVTAGVVRVQDGSILRLGQLSALRGTVFETEGTGELRGSGASDISSGLIEDSTVNGRVRLASYEYLSLGGTVHLDGEIVIDTDPGLTSALHFRSPTTFEGDGRITLLGDSTSYQAIGQYSGNTMAIPTGSSLTIGGGGSGYLLEDVAVDGLLQVTDGAAVVVDQSDLDGGGTQAGATAGVVRIQDGSTLRLGQLSALRGAVLETAGTGELRGSGASDISSGLIEDSTVNGRVRLGHSEYLSLGGVIHLDGEIVFDGSSGIAGLSLRSPTTLTGWGRVRCLSGSSSSISGQTLLTGPGLRVEGECDFYAELDNGGVLAPGDGVGTLTAYAPVTLEPTSVLEVEIDALAADTLRVPNGDALTLGGILVPIATPSALAVLEPEDEITVVETGFGVVPNGEFLNAAPGERVVGPNCESFRVEYGPLAANPQAVVLTDFLLLDCLLFDDDFESGNTSAWSSATSP